jgi:hypothetical protein
MAASVIDSAMSVAASFSLSAVGSLTVPAADDFQNIVESHSTGQPSAA